MESVIRSIVRRYGRLPVSVESLSDDSDLYHAGLTSYATVNMMVALERHFGVEFPERMLRRGTFQSIRTIEDAIGELRQRQEPAA